MDNKQELEGTSFNSLRMQNELTELDSLIAETLEESKAKDKPASKVQTDETHFAATPISISENKQEVEPNSELEIKLEKIEIQPEIKKPEEPVKAVTKQEYTEQQYEKTFKTYKPGDVIKGKVVKIDASGALVDIGYKSDGFIGNEEGLLDSKINVGDILDVYIESLNTKNGYAALSLKKANIEKKWNELFDSYKNKSTLETKVTSAVGGGLVVDYYGIRGFVPASQVAKKPDILLSDFVGKTIPIKTIEIDRRRGKLIFSHKLGNFERQQVDREKIFNQIDVGEILHGTVSSLKKFGAFVNVQGIEGLIHINDISWKRISDPAKILSIGQEIDVFVLGVDRINKKLSLGLKQLQPDPWVAAGEKYKPGQIVSAKVLRLAKFGAFVEIEEGIEGLIHNSELSIKGVEKPDDAVQIGETVKAMVLRISPEEQRIGLSIREVLIDEEKAKVKEVQFQAVPPKITIGDSIDADIKEQLSNQNEFYKPA